MSGAAVGRSVTAAVAAGLSSRSVAREALRPTGNVTGARLGLVIPIEAADTGVTVSGRALLDLVGVDLTGNGGGPTIRTERTLTSHVEIRRANGWLVGGPDPGRGPGPRPDHELRWIEANVETPLGAGGTARAELILHEPRVFGIARDRWIVRAAGAASAADEIVTPALPEVRVLLSHVAAELAAAAADSAVGALLDLFDSLALRGSGGGFMPDAVDHLLHDPLSHVRDALTDVQRRSRMATGLSTLLGGLAGVNVDLAARRVTLNVSGTPGERGLLPWSLQVAADATGAASLTASVGAVGSTAAGGAVVRVTTGPLAVSLDWHRPGTTPPRVIALWPAPDAAALARAAALFVPAELARVALEVLRGLDELAGALVDAALDAVGLLSAPDADGMRRVLLPVGLLADPLSWLRHASAFGGSTGLDPARAAAFLDAIKPVLGVAGDPGSLDLATGVTARDSIRAPGALRTALRPDSQPMCTSRSSCVRDRRLARTSSWSWASTVQPQGAAPSMSSWGTAYVSSCDRTPGRTSPSIPIRPVSVSSRRSPSRKRCP
jgi:hypothetical protein